MEVGVTNSFVSKLSEIRVVLPLVMGQLTQICKGQCVRQVNGQILGLNTGPQSFPIISYQGSTHFSKTCM